MSILRRTVYFDYTNGIARFWDWAVTLTTLGTMAEPFTVGTPHQGNTPVTDFDPTDEIARIDNITAKPRNVQQIETSGGVYHLNGGDLRPRTGP